MFDFLLISVISFYPILLVLDQSPVFYYSSLFSLRLSFATVLFPSNQATHRCSLKISLLFSNPATHPQSPTLFLFNFCHLCLFAPLPRRLSESLTSFNLSLCITLYLCHSQSLPLHSSHSFCRSAATSL